MLLEYNIRISFVKNLKIETIMTKNLKTNKIIFWRSTFLASRIFLSKK